MRHPEIRWSPVTKEWFCLKCGRASDHVTKLDAEAELSQFDCSSSSKEHVRQLLLLMDTDKSGKISKHEWMKFMEAEFDRLDKNKTGELDPQELLQSK